jgi:hypothetical protein
MGESILLNKYEIVSSHVVNLKIGGGRKLSLHPLVEQKMIQNFNIWQGVQVTP